MSNKVKSRIRTGENHIDRENESSDAHHSDNCLSDDNREDAASSGASTPRGDVPPSSFGVHYQKEEKSPGKHAKDSSEESEKPPIHKIITSKAEAWIGRRGLSWPWKGNEREGSEVRIGRSGFVSLQNDQEKISPPMANLENQTNENNRTVNEASGSWSSFNVNSTSSASSCGSTSSGAVNKVDIEADCLDCEILWEDLTIGEQIGQGNRLSGK